MSGRHVKPDGYKVHKLYVTVPCPKCKRELIIVSATIGNDGSVDMKCQHKECDWSGKLLFGDWRFRRHGLPAKPCGSEDPNPGRLAV